MFRFWLYSFFVVGLKLWVGYRICSKTFLFVVMFILGRKKTVEHTVYDCREEGDKLVGQYFFFFLVFLAYGSLQF